MGLFDRLMGRELPERKDGRKIYFRLLKQSRQKNFFGPNRVADDYDGRIDMITLHMAVMMDRLDREDADGKLLKQALFDEMKDDFEVSLREEGISDTGVKRRIKPMIGHFYSRLKLYSDALKAEDSKTAFEEVFHSADRDTKFIASLTQYTLMFRKSLEEIDFNAIRECRFFFPDL